jgi:hypothetical protein
MIKERITAGQSKQDSKLHIVTRELRATKAPESRELRKHRSQEGYGSTGGAVGLRKHRKSCRATEAPEEL